MPLHSGFRRPPPRCQRARTDATSAAASPLPPAEAVKAHAPYAEPDWQRDALQQSQGAQLACPDCGSCLNYGPRWHARADGTERHYRACKVCGFWQEADGSQPYRVWLPVHTCTIQLRPDQCVFHCPVCSTTTGSEQAGAQITHECGKYLAPWETGYVCRNCSTSLGPRDAKRFQSDGSG